MNRLALAGINPSTREISNLTKLSSRTALSTIGQTMSRDVFKKPLKHLNNSNHKSMPSIRSLFSTATYSARPIHTLTRELVPMVPGPWVKFRQLLTEHQKSGLPTSETLKKLEPGEIFERHKLSPNPLLSKIDGMAPHQAYRNRDLYIYLHEVKRLYLLAKNRRRKWELIRDRFRNDDFQAIVSDYLADCQMRRDRGEMTDQESDRRCSVVLKFLFGEQLKVEKEFQLAEQELNSCCEYLVSLKENPDQPEELKRRLKAIKNFNLHSHDPSEVQDLILSSSGGGLHRSSPSRLTPEPIANVFTTSEADDQPQCSTIDEDGVFLLTSHEDRLRISRALDQRVPSQYRLFNGKATTFNEARTTTTTSPEDLSPLNSGISPSDDTCSIEEAWDNFADKCPRQNNSRTFSFEIELGQKKYNLQLASKRTIKSSRKLLFQHQKHLLWGCFPSAGRKKFAEEEVILSEDDSYLTSSKGRLLPANINHRSSSNRGTSRSSNLKTLG